MSKIDVMTREAVTSELLILLSEYNLIIPRYTVINGYEK